MQKTLVFIVTVFFFWGFVAASNDILIPTFKEHLAAAVAESDDCLRLLYGLYGGLAGLSGHFPLA